MTRMGFRTKGKDQTPLEQTPPEQKPPEQEPPDQQPTQQKLQKKPVYTPEVEYAVCGILKKEFDILFVCRVQST